MKILELRRKKVNYSEQKNKFVRLRSYVFSIPSHNAGCERAFSLKNSQWSDDRVRLDISTVNAIISFVFNNKKSTDVDVDIKRTIFSQL